MKKFDVATAYNRDRDLTGPVSACRGRGRGQPTCRVQNFSAAPTLASTGDDTRATAETGSHRAHAER